MIAEAAYFRALNRAPHAASAEDDWFQAEQEINRALLERQPAPGAPSAPEKRKARASTSRSQDSRVS